MPRAPAQRVYVAGDRHSRATEANLLAHDASTGRLLYGRQGSESTVVLIDPGAGERGLFDLGPASDNQLYGAAIDGDWAIVAAGGVNDLGIHAVYASRVTGGDQIEVATRSSDGITSSNPVLYDG